MLQECIDSGGYDELIPVAGAEGMAWAKKLAQREGILTGISGGATFAVAMGIAERAAPGSVILAMLPDTGERYLTTPLFADIPEDMDAEEVGAVALDTRISDGLKPQCAVACGRDQSMTIAGNPRRRRNA